MNLTPVDHDDPPAESRFALAISRFAEADAKRSAELTAAWRGENGRCRYCGAPLYRGNTTGACGRRTSVECANRARRDARKSHGGLLIVTDSCDNVPSTSSHACDLRLLSDDDIRACVAEAERRGILPARQEKREAA